MANVNTVTIFSDGSKSATLANGATRFCGRNNAQTIFSSGTRPATLPQKTEADAFNALANGFKTYDTNKDGALDERELTVARNSLGRSYYKAMDNIIANEEVETHSRMGQSGTYGTACWLGITIEDITDIINRFASGLDFMGVIRDITSHTRLSNGMTYRTNDTTQGMTPEQLKDFINQYRKNNNIN